MENCTIYAHYLRFEKVVELAKAQFKKADIEMEDNGKQKSLVITQKGGFFSKTKTLTINYRERENPSCQLLQVEDALTQNLAGMANYMANFPTNNDVLKSQLLHKVYSLNCEMSFMGDPHITAEHFAYLSRITDALDAIVFVSPNPAFTKSEVPHFLDKELNLILDANGQSEMTHLEVNVDAKYHDPPAEEATEEQLERKANSEAFLLANSIKINENLPCTLASEEASLRSKAAIVERIYCLLAIAAKGEGLEQAHLDRVIEDKKITNFTAQEQHILAQETLDSQLKANATWRYESLNLLLWAAGKLPELVYPSTICDVEKIVGLVFKATRKDFENSVKLRSKNEILEALDRIYRMHWATVNARIKGEEVGGNIQPSIIYERHYALNWLTNQEAWDEVQTNT